MRNETIPLSLSQQKPTKVGMTHTSAGRCQPPTTLYKQINAVKCTCMIRWIQFFQVVLKTLQNSKEIFPAHLKYILLTSIKMRVFNIESFLCPFHRTISEYFVILLCYRSTKRKECIFANCHKSRIIFPATCCSLHFTLILLKVWKHCCLSGAQGKGFSFSLKLILMYFKELPSINIIHLSSYDPKTIPLEMKSFPKSVLAACFRQERLHWQCYQYSEMWQKPVQEHRVAPTTVPTVCSFSATRWEMLMCLTKGTHRDTHFGNKSTMNWLKLVSQKAPYQEVLKWRVKHAHTESRPYPASKTEE